MYVTTVLYGIDYHHDTTTSTNNNTTHHSHPLYLKDYERERLLEKGVMADISDTEEDTVRGNDGRMNRDRISYDEEQRDIRERLGGTLEHPTYCINTSIILSTL